MNRFGRIDLLVNNAGLLARTPFLESTEAEWDGLLNANLKSMYLTCRQFGETMWRQGGGSVVNLADVSAWLAWPNYVPYCVSKAGVVALTRGLARELAPRVRVNAVAPGVVAWSNQFTKSQRRSRLAQIPLNRIGTPEEVARAVVFLAESEYLTGVVLPVDGGRQLT
jgi:NAD(P)-dependent dehydrogenase (short-subunit alcohol dehydrogenase family)